MNSNFLEQYRELELELKQEGETVLEHETALEDPRIQEKMKLCRITRNFLIHNDDQDFFKCSRNMINFINDMTKEVKMQRESVRDRMVRRKPAHMGDSIKSIIQSCAKGAVPVTDTKTGRFLFLADADYIVKKMAKGRTKIERNQQKGQYAFVSKSDPLKGLPKGIYIVTSDGTKKGKYQGILEIKENCY